MSSIRIANKDEEDFNHVLGILNRFFESIDLSGVIPPRDTYERIAAVEKLFYSQFLTCILAMDNDKCVGAMGLFIAPYLWDGSKLSCEELFWWVDEGAPKTTAMRILKQMNTLIEDNDINIAVISSLDSSPKSLDRIYTKMGYKKMQTSYVQVN